MTINTINTEKLDAKRVFYALCKYAIENPRTHEFISNVPNIIINYGYNFDISYEDVLITNSTKSRRSSSLSLVGTDLKMSPTKNSISSDETEGRSSGQSTEIEKHNTNDSDEFALKNDLNDEKSASQFTFEDAEKLFKANSTKEFQTVVIHKNNVELPISMLHFAQHLDVRAYDRVYGDGAAVRAILNEFDGLTSADLEFRNLDLRVSPVKKGILNSFMQSLQCCYNPINQVDITPENGNARSPIKKSYKVIKSVPHVQKKFSMGR